MQLYSPTICFAYVFICAPLCGQATHKAFTWDLKEYYSSHFKPMGNNEKDRLRSEAEELFDFGYDNYMKHAFPYDELDPVHCRGRGHDTDDPDNININDALGDYVLTLVDSLDTLAVMGHRSEFKKACKLVVDHVTFDTTNEVQVFEATIRVLGGLLSAHMIIIDEDRPFGDLRPDWYDDELLHLAHDLGSRLLPAFSGTASGMPYPRVNLRDGVSPNDCLHCYNETCSAGVATLLLEFGTLSLLLNDPVYFSVAARSSKSLWAQRSPTTGLLGNVINIQSSSWVGEMSGIGAGLDSVFEYMLKSAVYFGDKEHMEMFDEAYMNIKTYMRTGRAQCDSGHGGPPHYVNVNMRDGSTMNQWIDSLSAAWPAVQVLYGDIQDAVCSHLLFYALWVRYEAGLPERWNWMTKTPDVAFYPLRPEFVEATYLLHQATKNPFYLHVGKDILDSLNKHTRVRCGFATVHNVETKELEDRMESFFLSETCKYLYLLFDAENPVHKNSANYIFTTQGHLLPVHWKYRERLAQILQLSPSQYLNSNMTGECDKLPDRPGANIPLGEEYLDQMFRAVGAEL